jgi:hypothetical protein
MPSGYVPNPAFVLAIRPIGHTKLLQGGPREYIDRLARCRNTLDIKKITSGQCGFSAAEVTSSELP